MPDSEIETQEGRMVNVRLRGELLDQFNKLCEAEMRDQSSMIRWLIATEYARRIQQPALFPMDGIK